MRSRMIIGLCALAIAFNSTAQEARTNPPVWELTLQKEPIRTIKPVFRAHLKSDKQEFVFFVPQEVSVINDAGTIKFRNAEGNCVMTLSVLGPAPEAGDLNTQSFQERLMAEHDNKAIVISSFSRAAAGRMGPGFDLEWELQKRIIVCQRTVYIPSHVGVLEFRATATRPSFPGVQACLDSVIATFREVKDGNLDKMHVSPNS